MQFRLARTSHTERKICDFFSSKKMNNLTSGWSKSKIFTWFFNKIKKTCGYKRELKCFALKTMQIAKDKGQLFNAFLSHRKTVCLCKCSHRLWSCGWESESISEDLKGLVRMRCGCGTPTDKHTCNNVKFPLSGTQVCISHLRLIQLKSCNVRAI